MGHNPTFMEKAFATLLALTVPSQSNAEDGFRKVPFFHETTQSPDPSSYRLTHDPPALSMSDLHEVTSALYTFHRLIDAGLADSCDLETSSVHRGLTSWIYPQAELTLGDPQRTKVSLGVPNYGDPNSVSFILQRGDKVIELSHIPSQCTEWRQLMLHGQDRMNDNLSPGTSCFIGSHGIKNGGELLAISCTKSTPLELRLTHSQLP